MIHDVKRGHVVLDANGCRGTRLYENGGNEYVLLEIEPGGAIPEHALPIPVDFCVMKGSGTVTVDGEEFQASEGQMLSCPPEVPRGWKNETPSKLEVLVIKSMN